MLGSGAGSASATQRAYYAGTGNTFWRALFEFGLTPRLLEAAQYEIAPQYSLGLTGLAKTVSGSDSVLSLEHFDRSCVVKCLKSHSDSCSERRLTANDEPGVT